MDILNGILDFASNNATLLTSICTLLFGAKFSQAAYKAAIKETKEFFAEVKESKSEESDGGTVVTLREMQNITDQGFQMVEALENTGLFTAIKKLFKKK